MSDFPSKMNAMQIVGTPGDFLLQQTVRPVPSPGKNEVLIAVYAAGINGHDVKQIKKGGHPIRKGETDLPGLEVSGVIAAVGTNANEWSVGDEVCALLRGGGYAEFATANTGNCLPKPRNLGWAESAVLAETFFTVWSNVFLDCRLSRGENFLMNGGTSGIGVAAIQIVSKLGHQVFATARGAEKAALCEKLGAQRGIDYEVEEFSEVLQNETNGLGVNVILDIVAGDYLSMNLDAAANRGRIVFIGGARGFDSSIDIRKLMDKQLTISGSLLRPRSNLEKRRTRDELLRRVWPLVESGDIDPMLYRSFDLSDASQAIDLLKDRAHIGKVALRVRN